MKMRSPCHPIFSGITALENGNGQSILDLGTNPNAEIVQLAGINGDQGVYAVVAFEPTTGDAVPEPITATLGLMGLGTLGMATRRRAA